MYDTPMILLSRVIVRPQTCIPPNTPFFYIPSSLLLLMTPQLKPPEVPVNKNAYKRGAKHNDINRVAFHVGFMDGCLSQNI